MDCHLTIKQFFIQTVTCIHKMEAKDGFMEMAITTVVYDDLVARSDDNRDL